MLPLNDYLLLLVYQWLDEKPSHAKTAAWGGGQRLRGCCRENHHEEKVG
jgi:hypothetical protein